MEPTSHLNESTARFLPEEVIRKNHKCPIKRLLVCLVVIGLVTLIVLIGVQLNMSMENTAKYKLLRNKYDDLYSKLKDKSSMRMVDRRINESDLSWKRKVDARLDFIDSTLRHRAGANETIAETSNKTFAQLTRNIDTLMSTVANLTHLSRMNVSTHLKVCRLRTVLKSVKNNLLLMRNELTRVNASLPKSIKALADPIYVGVSNLRQNLKSHRNWTMSNANSLWMRWNETSAALDEIVQLLSDQNITLHLKVKHHSDALYSEVKRVERNLASLYNATIRAANEEQRLRVELNFTRGNLMKKLKSEMMQTNESFSTAIKNMASLWHSSLGNLNQKVVSLEEHFHTNSTSLLAEIRNIDGRLSRMQDNARKHKEDTSSHADTIKNIKARQKNLEEELDAERKKREDLENTIQNLRDIVSKLKNKASKRSSRIILPLVLTALFVCG